MKYPVNLSKNPLVIAFAVCSILPGIHSCKKDNNKTTNVTHSRTSASLDFTYSGNLWVYDTIRFHSNAPSASTFLWIFGDGTTSADSTPFHIYTTINYTGYSTLLPDTVTLIVDNDTAHEVIKTLKITPGASRLAGTWHWTGGMHNPYGITVTGDTTYALPDTVFSITAIDDSTINVAWGASPYGNTLPFEAVVNAYTELPGFYGHWGSEVAYIHDTIFFAYACCGGNGHWDVTSYYTH